VQSAFLPGTSSTFEAVLFEGSNQIAFRYGTVDPLASGFAGVDDAAGAVGAQYPAPADASCSTLTLTVEPDPCAPACIADFTHTNGVDLLDIFAFLNAWFAGDPRANVNGTNGVDLLDIFFFLQHWFAGC
jgi:hypothetical protein